MIISQKENTTIIIQEKASIIELVKKIDEKYSSFKNNNIIVSITSLKPTRLEDIIEFLLISNKHRKNKKSFVIIAPRANFDEIPVEIMVVPTMQEAFDIIEMEEMERDLDI